MSDICNAAFNHEIWSHIHTLTDVTTRRFCEAMRDYVKKIKNVMLESIIIQEAINIVKHNPKFEELVACDDSGYITRLMKRINFCPS